MKPKLILLLAVILLLSSCARTESVISVAEETEARPNIEDAESLLFVNVSAQKIHYKPDCRYLKQSNEENISRVAYTDEVLQNLFSMEFVSCSNCRFPDYLD